MEPQGRAPVPAVLPGLLQACLEVVRERLQASPDFPIYLSIQRQLEYLRDVVAHGQSPDPDKIDSLTLGIYAAREFETSDPHFADVLFKVSYLANRMP